MSRFLLQKQRSAKLFSFACAAFLFAATVFQGEAFCLCPPDVTDHSEESCPCHGADSDAPYASSAAHDVVLDVSPHACQHLALEILQPAEQAPATNVALVRLPSLSASCLFTKPVLWFDHSTAQGMPASIKRLRHKSPPLITFQQQLR